MISDEERREVARKLREYVKVGEYLDFALIEAVTGTVDLSNVQGAPIGYVVADLIEPQERTCRNIHDVESYRWFECSECGCGLEVLNDEGISNIEDREGHFIDRPRYCPHCGARIVEVDE